MIYYKYILNNLKFKIHITHFKINLMALHYSFNCSSYPHL